MSSKNDWVGETKSGVVLSTFVLSTCSMAQMNSQMFFFKEKKNNIKWQLYVKKKTNFSLEQNPDSGFVCAY